MLYIEKKEIRTKNSHRQLNVTKKHSFLTQAPALITVLVFICNSSISWNTRFIFSLKVCMGFSIFDSILFLLKFIFILRKHLKTVNLFFNWDSLHGRRKSHYKAWSYKRKKNTKKLKHPADLFLKNLQLIIGAYWF